MASRLHDQLLSRGVDVIAGPDSYLHFPSLLCSAFDGIQASNIQLSTIDEYQSVRPLFQDALPCTQLTIMRGCNNYCAYCVVPYTRVGFE